MEETSRDFRRRLERMTPEEARRELYKEQEKRYEMFCALNELDLRIALLNRKGYAQSSEEVFKDLQTAMSSLLAGERERSENARK